MRLRHRNRRAHDGPEFRGLHRKDRPRKEHQHHAPSCTGGVCRLQQRGNPGCADGAGGKDPPAYGRESPAGPESRRAGRQPGRQNHLVLPVPATGTDVETGRHRDGRDGHRVHGVRFRPDARGLDVSQSVSVGFHRLGHAGRLRRGSGRPGPENHTGYRGRLPPAHGPGDLQVPSVRTEADHIRNQQ